MRRIWATSVAVPADRGTLGGGGAHSPCLVTRDVTAASLSPASRGKIHFRCPKSPAQNAKIPRCQSHERDFVSHPAAEFCDAKTGSAGDWQRNSVGVSAP